MLCYSSFMTTLNFCLDHDFTSDDGFCSDQVLLPEAHILARDIQTQNSAHG